MAKKEMLYEDIDNLLKEFNFGCELGATAVLETAEVEPVQVDPADKYEILAIKIGHFATGLFPRLPRIA